MTWFAGKADTRRTRPAAAASIALLALWTASLPAQTSNPVYVDDSPRTVTALAGVRDLAASDNLTEAVRILQSLLEEEGARVIAASDDPDLFVSVRSRIHAELLADADLLARYRRIEGPNGARLLAEGRLDDVERHRLFTPAGYEATLRLAQRDYESARFEAAWLLLRQLDRHPDRSGPGAEDARRLLIDVLAYLGLQDPHDIDHTVRQEAWAMLERWSQQARVPAPARRDPAPTPIAERFHSPWFNESLPDMEHLVAHPLPSVTFVESEELLDSLTPRTTSSMPANAQFLYVMPAVAGDIVFLNDGVSISAWNRFTLSREWSVRTDDLEPTYRASVGPSVEGTTSVTVEGPWVVGITGLNARNYSGVRQLITAIEVEGGEIIWQTTARALPDPVLNDLVFRGPVLIDQRTVVLAGSKQSSQRGLESRYLVGLDLVTGDLRWSRPLGSAGALRHGPRALEQEMPTARSGVTYYTDPVGFVAAVESATGRIQWIRRLEPEANQFDSREPWEGSAPLVVDDRVYTLTPDRLAIHAYDRASGELEAQVSAAHFDGPRYILHADGMIVGVARRSLWARPAEDLDAPMETIQLAQVPEPGIRGRVVVADDELVIPVVNGLRIVSAHGPSPDTERHLSLDDPGNVLPVESGLIVVDDRQFHPYLVWEVAERILRERMEAHPDDATDAVTLAALAHRAGRENLILATVDRAIRAIDANPAAPSSEKNRARLFRSLLDMIEPPPSLPSSVRLSDQLRSDLLDRLGLTATIPLERVAHLMARGQFFETIDQPRKAVESYQTILADQRLSESSYSQFDNTVSAEAEAHRRLLRIVRAHGVQVYDVFDEEAARQLDAARPSTDPATFERIARQYPLAGITASAWLAAADRHQARQRTLLAIHATEEALDAAHERPGHSDPPLGEIAGRLIGELRRAGRPLHAAQRLSDIRTSHPEIQLTEAGRPIDPEAVAAELQATLSQLDRRPVIDAGIGAPSVLTGWRLVTPAATPDAPPLTDHLMLESQEGEMALWRIESGGPTRRWGGVRADEILLRLDESGAYFVRPLSPNQPEQNYTVIRRDVATGAVVWASLGFEEALAHDTQAPGDMARRVQRFSTPLRPDVSPSQVMFDSDAQTIVLAERSGRIAAFDAATGALLWSRGRTIDRIYDAALDAGTLLLGGVDVRLDDIPINSDDDGMTHFLQAIDARTGDTLFRREEPDAVRWVAISPDNRGVIGSEDGIASFDLFRGAEEWRLDSADVSRSKAAWAFPGRLLVLNEGDWLWQVDAATGALGDDTLDTRDRLDGAIPWIATRLLHGNVAIASLHGLMLFDPAGALVGVSLPSPRRTILAPAFARDHIVTIEREGAAIEDAPLNGFALNTYTAASGRILSSTILELGVPPESIEVVDHAIVVSAGWATIILPTVATPDIANPSPEPVQP